MTSLFVKHDSKPWRQNIVENGLFSFLPNTQQQWTHVASCLAIVKTTKIASFTTQYLQSPDEVILNSKYFCGFKFSVRPTIGEKFIE